jgi:site-specific DNA recombinase
VVVVYCLDRLSRDPTHGVIITQELEKHHVTLEAVIETIDSSELGKLISYIRGFASKLEAEKIRERTMRGKKAYVQMGKMPIGTGKGLYGYKWDKENKRRIPLEFEAKIVQRIFSMLADGIGCFNIARTLNATGIPAKTGGKWSTRTVYNIAGNLSYIGMTYYGQTHGSRKTKLIKQPKNKWILLPDTTPAIISKELFDRVQEIRQQNRELHKAKATHDYLLRGHAYCGYCGSPLVGSFLNHRFRYYHCRATYATAIRTKTCTARYIRADYLEDIVWQSIRKVLENPELVMAGVKEQLETEQNNAIQGVSFDKEIQKLRTQIKNYDSQEKRLVQLFRYGEISQDSILDELNQLKREREADKLELGSLMSTKERVANLEKAEIKLGEYCQKLKNNLDSASYQDKRDILDMLAIKVTATPDTVSIDGIIPLETTPMQTSDKSSVFTHHWTNMGITVPL